MQDEVDHWLTDWARQRRIMLGIVLDEKVMPEERLGKLRCTLASFRECQIPAFSKEQQRWPEVYKGKALLVHRARQTMSYEYKWAIDLQYVLREVQPALKARDMRWSLAQYWNNVNGAKGFIRGYSASQKTEQTSRAAINF